MNQVGDDPRGIAIRTRYVLHQRVYEREILFTPSEVGEKSWKWLYPALREWASQARIKAVGTSNAKEVLLGLRFGSTVPGWDALISSQPGDCRLDTVIRFLSSFDNALREGALGSERSLTKISQSTRSFLLRFMESEGASDIRRRVQRLYKSPHNKKYVGRQLISDMPWPGRPPLSALPHKTYAELAQAIRIRLKEDLDLIIAACSDVLERYEKALEALDSLANIEFSEERRYEIQNKYRFGVGIYPRLQQWDEQELWDYLCILASDARAQPLPVRQKENKRGGQPPGINDLIKSRLHQTSNGAGVRQLLRLAIAPPTVVLLACSLIIQRATHWNYMSVLELEADQLEIKQFPHKIQSVKPRTEDETPIVWIERVDSVVIRALRILTERKNRLVGAGIVERADKRIWLSSSTVLKGKPAPVVGWGGELRRFTKRYNLPPFSLEQMRVQCLATVSAGVGGVNEVIWIAGHSDSRTSLHYIDKVLMQRLHDASNLEFERRLEATVVYMMDGKVPDRELLAYPIGDGASCTAPEIPPNEEWLSAGLCKAEKCHVGSGCPNRAIVIDDAKIEEVVRLKEFYRLNWKRLAAENAVRFERIQLPQMLFNYALYGVLKRGPYRHLVKNHESQCKCPVP